MPFARLHVVAAILALGACSDPPAGNAANAAAADDSNAMSTQDANLAAEAEARASGTRVYPGANAAAGDVIPGQEVMFIGQGLQVGTISLHPGQTYEFGIPRATIVAVARNLRGAPTDAGRLSRCREGRIDYMDFGNLRLFFQHDRFVGWDAASGDPPFRDEWGFHIGSERIDITDFGDGVHVSRTAQGWMFESDGVHGRLSSGADDAVVTDLWAGTVCTPR